MSANVVDINPVERSRAVISAIGHDRPGLVSGLTALVTELNLSIDDSRMSALGGDFAMLLSVTGAEAALTNLEANLARYCQEQSMEFLFRRSSERQPGTGLPYLVRVTAMDHPGIVRNVTGFFSERAINIVELNTDTQPAPHTGTPMFSLQLTVELPATQSVAQLKQAFAEFCEELGLDGNLQLSPRV